ncbi:MAG: glycosyltransferase [bacterium]|nr:glycosyltransferase [bacterium]
MTYSIIVAVYNRPDELRELLESLTLQTYTDFELIIVEDGSSITSKEVCDSFSSSLRLRYFTKDNSGPGPSRNFGCRRASGDWFIFLDSDCTAPPKWLATIHADILKRGLDAFGGPDREHENFSSIQKAISYSMTSVFTTGGIRGGKVRVGGSFHPRSFNMGISREVLNRTDGFSRMRFGEDIDFSIRIIEAGFNVGLIADAWVYHKRRSNFKKFFKQVYNSGAARIDLSLRHPGTLKITHFFPAAFLSYLVAALLYTSFVYLGEVSLLPLVLYLAVLAVDAGRRFRSVPLIVLAVAASVIQLVGYGLGFTIGIARRVVLGRPEAHAFEQTYYS